jgi:hypothetical protein
MWNTAVTCVPNCENCTRAVSELLYHNELSPHRLRSSSRRRRRRFCGDKKYRRQTGTVKGNYEPYHMVVWEYQWQRRRELRSPPASNNLTISYCGFGVRCVACMFMSFNFFCGPKSGDRWQETHRRKMAGRQVVTPRNAGTRRDDRQVINNITISCPSPYVARNPHLREHN